MSSELYDKMQPFLGDEQELCRRMAGRMDLWEECVRLFPGAEILEEMDGAFRTGDYTEGYAVIHRLKGNLANFGFDSAAIKASGALQAIKEQDIQKAEQYCNELRKEYLQIIERIGEVK